MTVDDGSGDAGSVYEPIAKMEWYEAVREVPAMYIGDVHDGTGLHTLLMTPVGRAVEAHLAGRCERADLTLLRDGGVEVGLDADGNLFDHPEDVDCPGQRTFTDLSLAGYRNARTPDFRYGQWIQGLMLVSAVCERLTADFSREGRRWHLAYERGVPREASSTDAAGETRGVVLRFKPDPTIFTSTAFDAKAVASFLRELAFLVRGMTFTLRDEVGGGEHTFCAREGLADCVRFLCGNGPTLLGPPVEMRAELPDAIGPWMKVEIALQWTAGLHETVVGYTNGVRDHGGGTHIAGLTRSLIACVTVYGIEAGLIPSGHKLVAGVVREGLVAAISLWHCDAHYCSPTRARLTSPEVIPFVEDVVKRQLYAWLRAHPTEARLILDRILQADAACRAR